MTSTLATCSFARSLPVPGTGRHLTGGCASQTRPGSPKSLRGHLSASHRTPQSEIPRRRSRRSCPFYKTLEGSVGVGTLPGNSHRRKQGPAVVGRAGEWNRDPLDDPGHRGEEHAWCDLCPWIGDKPVPATQRRFWHSTPLGPSTCREVVLCDECAEMGTGIEGRTCRYFDCPFYVPAGPARRKKEEKVKEREGRGRR